MAPKNLKLIYFDARGRAEIIRLVLAATGQKFEDIRITQEQWPSEKPKTPFGQVPVIEIDGKKYGQGLAIATYCAREFGLYGKSNLDALQIDQVVQLGVDFKTAATKLFYEKDEKKKEEILKSLKEVEVPKYLGFFEKLLKENKTGYFVGNSLTLADVYVYDTIYFMVKKGILTTEGFPHLQELYKKIVNHDKLKPYLEKRKDTDM
ncbi:glutathione S-transferase 7 [Biomphalaria pfeifferi]|uniref:Glutathione S-transferase 7 n=1 Tax=Biomphalaria pfeifferi TaxID=112525 RepID=A0AAD8AVA0_BIOPF|nr:glutathione S-transferase 7 [Biomphalaria pfeifferi]